MSQIRKNFLLNSVKTVLQQFLYLKYKDNEEQYFGFDETLFYWDTQLCRGSVNSVMNKLTVKM